MYPRVEVDLQKIRHNAAQLVKRAKRQRIELWAVTKVLSGRLPQVGRVLLDSGMTGLAEARLDNLQRWSAAGVAGRKVLLRLPAPSQAQQVVVTADISLNSQLATLTALSAAAVGLGVRHRVLLMVDLGDLREGVWPEDLPHLARQAMLLPGIEPLGIGTNLTCFGGVIPSAKSLGELVALAQDLEARGIMQSAIISGGNSSSWHLLEQGEMPVGINNLRLGDAVLLGHDPVGFVPITGLHTDAFVLRAEVIEVLVKPSVPIGRIGRDAFGNVPRFQDRGLRRRAILAIGRQDVDPAGLTPLQPGVEVLGASSDHLVLDTTDFPGDVCAGDTFAFSLNYVALLRASTSKDVQFTCCQSATAN
ncbi:MAG: alanine/ornithine racemase family PLP-dependent enzyme [Bacillota bacterium]|jgi:predicted amino acid racemase